jgi:hypothetical protein
MPTTAENPTPKKFNKKTHHTSLQLEGADSKIKSGKKYSKKYKREKRKR